MSSQIMYHVAPVVARDEIAGEGLTPQSPHSDLPAGVYMFADEENALFFAEHMSERDRDEYGTDDPGREVWQVNTSELHLLDDPDLSEDDPFQAEYPVQPLRSFYSTTGVASERIKLLPHSVRA